MPPQAKGECDGVLVEQFPSGRLTSTEVPWSDERWKEIHDKLCHQVSHKLACVSLLFQKSIDANSKLLARSSSLRAVPSHLILSLFPLLQFSNLYTLFFFITDTQASRVQGRRRDAAGRGEAEGEEREHQKEKQKKETEKHGVGTGWSKYQDRCHLHISCINL